MAALQGRDSRLGVQPACLGKLVLNTPRQFVLALGRHQGIFSGHFQIAVPGNLGGFDGAAADLLPPSDVGSPEGVRPQAGEIATLCRGRVERERFERITRRRPRPRQALGCDAERNSNRLIDPASRSSHGMGRVPACAAGHGR